jgi:hypothetical protein
MLIGYYAWLQVIHADSKLRLLGLRKITDAFMTQSLIFN